MRALVYSDDVRNKGISCPPGVGGKGEKEKDHGIANSKSSWLVADIGSICRCFGEQGGYTAVL